MIVGFVRVEFLNLQKLPKTGWRGKPIMVVGHLLLYFAFVFRKNEFGKFLGTKNFLHVGLVFKVF